MQQTRQNTINQSDMQISPQSKLRLTQLRTTDKATLMTSFIQFFMNQFQIDAQIASRTIYQHRRFNTQQSEIVRHSGNFDMTQSFGVSGQILNSSRNQSNRVGINKFTSQELNSTPYFYREVQEPLFQSQRQDQFSIGGIRKSTKTKIQLVSKKPEAIEEQRRKAREISQGTSFRGILLTQRNKKISLGRSKE